MRLAYQEMINGGIQLQYTKDALQQQQHVSCPTARVSLVTNVSAGLGGDGRQSGIEALCLYDMKAGRRRSQNECVW